MSNISNVRIEAKASYNAGVKNTEGASILRRIDLVNPRRSHDGSPTNNFINSRSCNLTITLEVLFEHHVNEDILGSTAEAGNLHFLQTKLVVICQLLPDPNALLRIYHYLFLTFNSDDLCVAIWIT